MLLSNGTNTRYNTRELQHDPDAPYLPHTPFLEGNQSGEKTIGELMGDSTPGGLTDEYSQVNTRADIFPQNDEQEKLTGLANNVAAHPAFSAQGLKQITQAPHVTGFWNVQEQINRFYRHDTFGNPYLNSSRLSTEGYKPTLAAMTTGAVTGTDRPGTSENAEALYNEILKGTDNRDKAVSLFLQRYGTPENLNELVKTGHLHESDLQQHFQLPSNTVIQNSLTNQVPPLDNENVYSTAKRRTTFI